MRFLFRLFLLFVLVIALVWVFREPLLHRLGLATSAGQTGSETRERPGRRSARPAGNSPTSISASRGSPRS